MRGVIGLIISVIMIIGGLSGNLVLKGTDSGGALAAVGGVFLVINVFRIVQTRSS